MGEDGDDGQFREPAPEWRAGWENGRIVPTVPHEIDREADTEVEGATRGGFDLLRWIALYIVGDGGKHGDAAQVRAAAVAVVLKLYATPAAAAEHLGVSQQDCDQGGF